MLTQAQVKELFDYDPKTGNLIWRSNRGTKKVAGKIAGWKSSIDYIYVLVNGKKIPAHRVIWLHVYGSMPDDCIDHINGDRADNRIENLREATRAQNQQNFRTARTDSSSGYMGVSRNGNKWMAKISLNKRQHYIGLYATPEDAYAAYLAKKRELHPFGTL